MPKFHYQKARNNHIFKPQGRTFLSHVRAHYHPFQREKIVTAVQSPDMTGIVSRLKDNPFKRSRSFVMWISIHLVAEKMNNQSIVLTREQLYEKVWTRPVWSLAKEWGISDVGLAKICKKHNIPRPGPGYWARKEHGYNPRQTPLPKGDGAGVIEIPYYKANPRVFDDEQAQKAREKGAAEGEIENRIVVSETLNDPHPLIVHTEKNLRGAKRDEKGFLTATAKGSLSLVSAPASVGRAMRILDALIKALESRGMKIRIEDGDHKSCIGSPWHHWWYSTYLTVLGSRRVTLRGVTTNSLSRRRGGEAAGRRRDG